jgi:ankyrin repeat protein/urea transporter
MQTNLFNDYKEISIWNPQYASEFKTKVISKKPFYKYLMGTMSDQHIYIQNNTPILLFVSLFRSIGILLGVSNPILGLCFFIATLLDKSNKLLSVFLVYGITISICICCLLKIDRELIYNGLYPSNAIFASLYLYFIREDNEPFTILKILGGLIPLTFMGIIIFQSLCEIFVKKLKISPLALSPTIMVISWVGMTLYSSHFPSSVSPEMIIPPKKNLIDINIKDFFLQMPTAVAGLCFSTSPYSAIPITIGISIASPILAVTTWSGAFLSVLFQYLMGIQIPDGDALFFLLPINGIIVFSVISGTFFILNYHSVIFGIFGVFLVNMLTCAFSALLKPSGLPYLALPAQIIIILFYLNVNTFKNFIKVELDNLTVPEDHLRRYHLSITVMKRFHIVNNFMKNNSLSPNKLKEIEQTLLPILMCSYSKFGLIDKMKELLILGADVNLGDYDGRRALHIAASEGNFEMIKLLLQYNCDINIKDNYENTPLSDALTYKYYDIAKYLYQNGGKVLISSEILASKLCYMVYNKKNKELQNWLDNGVSPNISDYDDRTPMHIATNIKNEKAIELLTKYKANINLIDRWGKNANNIHINILEDEKSNNSSNNSSIKFTYFTLLKDRRFDPFVNNDLIQSVIIELIKKGDDHMKRALLPSLICSVVYLNDIKLLNQIINMGIKINQGDYDNRTPLHIASACGHEDILRILIWNGSDINTKDRFGFTALYEAVQHNNKNITDILQEKFAKMGLDNESSAAILCWAAYNNDISLIDRFYKNGININSADYDGRKCIDIARDIENNNLVNYLQSLPEFD